MSNFDRCLDILIEKPVVSSDEVTRYQAKNKGMSWADAKAHLEGEAKAAEKVKKKEEKADAPKKPKDPKGKKPKSMTDKDLDKMCRGAREDFLSDNPEGSIEDVAYDLADNMLYDPKVLAFVQRKFNTLSRSRLKELLADRIAG